MTGHVPGRVDDVEAAVAVIIERAGEWPERLPLGAGGAEEDGAVQGEQVAGKGRGGVVRLAFLEDGGGTLTDYEGRVGEERGIAAVVPVDVGEEDVGDVGGL